MSQLEEFKFNNNDLFYVKRAVISVSEFVYVAGKMSVTLSYFNKMHALHV